MTVEALEIRVRGRVQGVGFRPSVFRLARELGLAGEVQNDAEGVLIRASGTTSAMASFLERIAGEAPLLARVEALETRVLAAVLDGEFRVVESGGRTGGVGTEVAPDAAICGECVREIGSAAERRFRYPFATCTQCGPRLSIVRAVPYDRAATTMASFPLCAACDAEYRDPGNRRFHAEATGCGACGPRARLLRFDVRTVHSEPAAALDDVEATLGVIQGGGIVAIKGLGGYQLACDATRAETVAHLRERKKRDAKPFALMARDVAVIRRYCTVSAEEERLLAGPSGPIVLLSADGSEALPDAIAPGYRTLGFMLPTTPLHALVLQRMDRPVVMTSGNLSDAPPIVDDTEACERLAGIVDGLLLHDRIIVNRVDDSVACIVDGRVRLLRRARGYAPGPIRLPAGFEVAPPLLAYGGELKATFCLLADGQAVLSQHQGDLTNAATLDDYGKNLALYADLFEHRPLALVGDRHPDYASSKRARERASIEGLPLVEVQHHHAHAAACLAENGWPLAGPPVLGIVLDGLGLGEGESLWGGEFLLADYRHAERLGTFKPVALLGGDRASREPWRNLYAHLMAEMGWGAFAADFGDLEVHRLLARKPRAILDRMLSAGINAPEASSCGRLFDAVAAATGLAFERQAYEGQAGALLEAAVDLEVLRNEGEELAYPFSIRGLDGKAALPCIEPLPMWRALLGDQALGVSTGVIAARFHRGLARAIGAMAVGLARKSSRGQRPRTARPGQASAWHGVNGQRFDTVALSGGCFQNRILFEETSRRLETSGFRVLSHGDVPANDGGLALGQAAVAAARLIHGQWTEQRGGGA
jgi:hydrogenase maturation protein HypF